LSTLKTIIILAGVQFFYINNLIAQENCLSGKLYKTKFVKDGKDSSSLLSLPLNFIFRNDSVVVSYDEIGKRVLMEFRIMNKDCKWNEDFSEGASVYKLLMGGILDRNFPTLTITSNKIKKKNNEIELLYENGGVRIFLQ
jgi:hypothetical protein